MSLKDHIEMLRARHAALEGELADEDRRPHPNDAVIRRLKREKLRLKDEIAALDRAPAV
jgi:uncharacterized protein